MLAAYRYFEGQLSAISEIDAEELPEDSPVTVVEAADKVWSIPYFFFLGVVVI